MTIRIRPAIMKANALRSCSLRFVDEKPSFDEKMTSLSLVIPAEDPKSRTPATMKSAAVSRSRRFPKTSSAENPNGTDEKATAALAARMTPAVFRDLRNTWVYVCIRVTTIGAAYEARHKLKTQC